MSSDDNLGEALGRLLPKSLDQLITRHREHAELRVSTEADLAPLRTSVVDDGSAQDIAAWTLITFDWHRPGEQTQLVTILVGDHVQKGRGFHTSPVLRLDEKTGCVRTRNKHLYRMSGPASKESDLLFMCHWLHKSGVGSYLGALPVFY